jgi:LuxR family quorum sensing-dependent transcriptional regulator
MTDLYPSRFDRGLRFLERCAVCPDVPALVNEFVAATTDFGLDAVACGGWAGFGFNRANRFYFNTWPAAWLHMYQENQFILHDAVVDEAQRRMIPFIWEEAWNRGGLSKPSKDLRAALFRFGWADGFAVPVHGPAGYQGLVGFAAFHPLTLSHAERSLLWIMSLSIHDRCRTDPGYGSESLPPRLTARELEVMRWAAAGKTEWEIGQLLGIAASTAHFHIGRVMRRLGTSSRTNAVALLVLHGIL